MKVTEIFTSIEGEGKRAGLPCTFIRLAGCNLRCGYCDTKYSYDADLAADMSVAEIIEKCNVYSTRLITLTGGEPLIAEGVETLIEELQWAGFYVNIETNGSVNIAPFKKLAHKDKLFCLQDKLFFTVDYKCPTSGMEHKMDISNLKAMDEDDVLKFVVGSNYDLHTASGVIINSNTKAQIYFSPVWGDISMKEIVEFMLDHKLNQCKIQAQLHKIIWDPAKRGV